MFSYGCIYRLLSRFFFVWKITVIKQFAKTKTTIVFVSGDLWAYIENRTLYIFVVDMFLSFGALHVIIMAAFVEYTQSSRQKKSHYILFITWRLYRSKQPFIKIIKIDTRRPELC